MSTKFSACRGQIYHIPIGLISSFTALYVVGQRMRETSFSTTILYLLLWMTLEGSGSFMNGTYNS